MAKILLVEDDQMVAEAVKDSLEVANHTIEWTIDGCEGLDRLLLYDYDLAILDWSVPGMSGLDVCREYRARGGLVPVLMLTGKTAISEKVHGFDAGADDYLTKPFHLHELQARVRALLRRPREVVQDILSLGDLEVDLKQCKASKQGHDLGLLPKELALLEFFIRHRNQVFSVNDLLNRLWSSESDSTEDAVRQCIARLRKKIDADGEASRIVTVKGLGYKMVDPSA